MKPTLVWFRQDLRLQDNPALHAALARGAPIVPVYIDDVAGEGPWPGGGATRWWLHHSLAALAESLLARGSRLVLAKGDSAVVLTELLRATGADAVYWNRRYEPAVMARDAAIKADLTGRGLDVRSFNGSLLNEPHAIANKQGKPFQVFTPYWRHCLTLPVASPLQLGRAKFTPPERWPHSLDLAALELLPSIPWDTGFTATWIDGREETLHPRGGIAAQQEFGVVPPLSSPRPARAVPCPPGEAGAAQRLKLFVAAAMEHYSAQRNYPGVPGTSMLSPHLHFGELSPRQIWAALREASAESGVFPPNLGATVFLSEVGWREFAYHLLFHFPHTPEQPLREEFSRFPWAADPGGRRLRAWQRGQTGYPIVDAGMRQLWHTGWMHNRVRMVVASFLVKHLRLPWNEGARWFWDTLVDADLASNTLGWQWSAGCGADAAPYFRIFAPVLQGRKFDASGEYVRRWVPELAALPAEHIHAPWEADPAVLKTAGVRLGRDYPHPIVDHGTARDEALAALQTLRAGNRGNSGV